MAKHPRKSRDRAAKIDPPSKDALPADSSSREASAVGPSPGDARSTQSPAKRAAELDPWVRYLALSALSGVLWFLACANFDIWPLAWVAMVPQMYVSRRCRTARGAFLYAWFGGTVAVTGGFYWITELLTRFAHFSFPLAAALCVLLCAYQSLPFAFSAFITRRVTERSRIPTSLIAPLSMVAFEFALPMLFPFHIGITQAWQIHVIQIADVTGALGVSALLMMVNGAIYDLWTDRANRGRSIALSAGLLALALAYGHVRIVQTDRARARSPQLRVGLVQPNVGFGDKAIDHPENAGNQLTDLQDASVRVERAGAELVVWPETAYPYTIDRRAVRDLPDGDPDRMRRGLTVPLIAGAVTRDYTRRAPGQRRRLPYNSALMVDRNGRITGRFDKVFLLLFGEYTPGRESFALIDRLLPDTAGQFARGTSFNTLPFTASDGRVWRLAPMICYEDILENIGRQLGRLHPHLIVNITNDAWFGATSEPWEHLALAVFRAVELRVDMVRAVNTGVSAFIDANGRVFARTYSVDPDRTPHRPDGIVRTVALREGGHTVFARVGNVFPISCGLATLWLWMIKPWWRRRRGAAAPAETRGGP